MTQATPSHMVALDRTPLARFRRQVQTYGVPLSKTAVGEFSACPARWAFKTVERWSPGAMGQELQLGRPTAPGPPAPSPG